MPQYLRIQVSIPMDNGLPEDAVTNTWHFIGEAAVRQDSVDDAVNSLITFYQAIDNALLASVVNSPATWKAYDLSDASPRVPIDEGTIALVPAAGDPCPSQVAVCLSFQGTPVSGEPQARKRGRVFIGPVPTSIIGVATGFARPSPAARDILRDAAAALLVDAPDASWAVYSPTTDASETLADAFFPVASGWVDDRFDTQRRRLPAVTVRDTF